MWLSSRRVSSQRERMRYQAVLNESFGRGAYAAFVVKHQRRPSLHELKTKRRSLARADAKRRTAKAVAFGAIVGRVSLMSVNLRPTLETLIKEARDYEVTLAHAVQQQWSELNRHIQQREEAAFMSTEPNSKPEVVVNPAQNQAEPFENFAVGDMLVSSINGRAVAVKVSKDALMYLNTGLGGGYYDGVGGLVTQRDPRAKYTRPAKTVITVTL